MIDDKVEKWIIKALEDFKTAEHELSFPEKEIVTSSVCFHCQQFVEKILKAYLTSKGVDFGKTHDMDLLLKLCIKEDREFEMIEIGDLTPYAVEVRYPDEFYIPSIEEAKESFEIAKHVKKIILKKLGSKEEM